MIRRALASLAAAAALLALGAAAGAPSADAQAIWRLQQPPPPPGAPFTVPLGAPGDLKFWSINRGLLTVEGNETIPRGIYNWNGREWHRLATVCGGSGDTARIAWAGPTEFWVISEPSAPRAGAGLALCRFKDGQVVGSFSTRVDAPDPFRQMASAACNGPNDCWFGGVGSQDPIGERVGAFHLHWNGSTLETIYGPQGRSVSDMLFHGGVLFESTLVGRTPENRTDPVDLAQPEPVPSLVHRISGTTFTNDPFIPSTLPGVPADGTELLALDSDGTDMWAGGGGAASGPSAPQNGSVARPPLAARQIGGELTEVPLTGAAFGPGDRIGDIASMPGSSDAMAAIVPFGERRSTTGDAIVARIQAGGETSLTSLPVAGSGRGAAARIACPAPEDCWLATWAGWLFHYSDGSAQALDTDPAFAGTIEFRPNESAEQFVPDTPPIDDSQIFAPAPVAPAKPAKPGKTRNRPPLLRRVRSKVEGMSLTVSFRVTRRARVQLLAKRRGRVVAKSPYRVFAPGRRKLTVRLDRENYPTALEFRTKELK